MITFEKLNAKRKRRGQTIAAACGQIGIKVRTWHVLRVRWGKPNELTLKALENYLRRGDDAARGS